MNVKWILPLALLTAAPALAPAAASTGSTRSCREVHFAPHSDNIAGDIRVRDVSCRTARRFVRAAGGRPGARFRGYDCTVKELDSALPSWRYRCVSGGRLIRWVKT